MQTFSMTINVVRQPQLQLEREIEVYKQRSGMTTKEEPPKPLISYFSRDKQPPLSGLPIPSKANITAK
jgi:hypothetical protein